MTIPDGPSRGLGGRYASRARRLARVLWTLRPLGLFLIGPIVGIGLVGTIFGLTPGLRWIGGGAILLDLLLFALLGRAEWRRLSAEP